AHGADRGEDLLPRRIFEQVTLRALAQAAKDVLIPVIGRHDEQPRARMALEHLLDDRESVAHHGMVIGENHADLPLRQCAGRAAEVAARVRDRAVCLLRHGDSAGVNGDPLSRPCAYFALRRATFTATRVPSPGRLSILNSPPIALARSRMLVSPKPR